ncbi:type 1 periplasmic-binding domain-containing protein [Lentzea nigeriaca]|uniref:hypothetical protein n=1 Tax=Lentzea nigeriaca TaxID=1128665 RepID=UPI001EF98F88|nr:ABC-type sugar transport system substrate-binding protein [Lentzea nigeriaca]
MSRILLIAVAALLVTGCTSRESRQAAASGGAAAWQQSGGPGCARSRTGYPQVDVKGATVGFSQSEKDEAGKKGVNLLVTNAQSDLNKHISDIKSLLNRGAKLLIAAPLNSDGLQPRSTRRKPSRCR